MRCVACRLSGRARVMRDPDRRAAAATERQHHAVMAVFGVALALSALTALGLPRRGAEA